MTSTLLGAHAVTADGDRGDVVGTARRGRIVLVRLASGRVVRSRVERLRTPIPVSAGRSPAA